MEYIFLPTTLRKYEEWLESIAGIIAKRPSRPAIIAGDFNAKSTMWGAIRTDARRRAIEKWAAQLELVLHNTGTTSTCVRRLGESIIDLTWATPAASRKIHNWRVAQEIEVLSDHRDNDGH